MDYNRTDRQTDEIGWKTKSSSIERSQLLQLSGLAPPQGFRAAFSYKRVYFAAIRLRPHKDMKIYESKEKNPKDKQKKV